MLMFFKKSHQKLLKQEKLSNFFKTRKIMVLEILTFDFCLEQKRHL